MLTIDAKISIPEDVLFREVDGEAVLLNIESGKYFGLDEIGTRMWQLLSEHEKIGDAFSRLSGEYDVDEDKLRQDLLGFIEKLSGSGLLQVQGN